MLGSDGISDRMPFGDIPNWPFPIHQIGITAHGPAPHRQHASRAARRRCAAHERWEFLLTVNPLRIPGGTGCPVNPVAMLVMYRPADPRRSRRRRHRPARASRRRRRSSTDGSSPSAASPVQPRTDVIDADGLVVAPGIVDIHTHYDPQLTWDPLCDTSALHGVTTVAAGNCGFSIAPCRDDDHDVRRPDVRPGRRHGSRGARSGAVGLRDVRRVPRQLVRGRLGINVGMYVGHSALRRWVMGDASSSARPPRPSWRRSAICSTRRWPPGRSGSRRRMHRPTSTWPAVPCRAGLASIDEMRALADVIGRSGVGSIAYAPGSAVEGIDAADRDLLIELRDASRGAGGDPGARRTIEGRRPDRGLGSSRARSSTDPPRLAHPSTPR